MVRLVTLLAGLSLAIVAILSFDGGRNGATRNGLAPTDDVASSGENVALVPVQETGHALPATIRRLADSPATGPLRPTIIGVAQPIIPEATPAALGRTDDGHGEYRRVSAARANVRVGPSTSHDVIDSVTRGEEVEIISGPENGWLQIRIQGDGIEGWVSASLLER